MRYFSNQSPGTGPIKRGARVRKTTIPERRHWLEREIGDWNGSRVREIKRFELSQGDIMHYLAKKHTKPLPPAFSANTGGVAPGPPSKERSPSSTPARS